MEKQKEIWLPESILLNSFQSVTWKKVRASAFWENVFLFLTIPSMVVMETRTGSYSSSCIGPQLQNNIPAEVSPNEQSYLLLWIRISSSKQSCLFDKLIEIFAFCKARIKQRIRAAKWHSSIQNCSPQRDSTICFSSLNGNLYYRQFASSCFVRNLDMKLDLHSLIDSD